MAFSLEEILAQEKIRDMEITEGVRKKIKTWENNPEQCCEEISEHFFGGHEKKMVRKHFL